MDNPDITVFVVLHICTMLYLCHLSQRLQWLESLIVDLHYRSPQVT